MRLIAPVSIVCIFPFSLSLSLCACVRVCVFTCTRLHAYVGVHACSCLCVCIQSVLTRSEHSIRIYQPESLDEDLQQAAIEYLQSNCPKNQVRI